MSRLATFALLAVGLQQAAARSFGGQGGPPAGYGGASNAQAQGHGGPPAAYGGAQGGPPSAQGGAPSEQHGGPPSAQGGAPFSIPTQYNHAAPSSSSASSASSSSSSVASSSTTSSTTTSAVSSSSASSSSSSASSSSASSSVASSSVTYSTSSPVVYSSASSSSVIPAAYYASSAAAYNTTSSGHNTTTTVLHTNLVVETECANSSTFANHSSTVSQSAAGAYPIVIKTTTTASTTSASTAPSAVEHVYTAPSTVSNPLYSSTSTNGAATAASNATTPQVTVSAASATTTLNASSVAAVSPNGGILSIPPSATAPVQSLLATYPECEALMDNQLPGKDSIPSNFNFSGNVRTYYIAAEEVAWNYAPSGWDNWLGVPIGQSPRAAAGGYLNISGSIGQDGGLTWQKAAYRGYTDATFTQKTEQDQGAGLNGPTLRAEVNDMIQILFVNNLSKNYASMHSMGLYYGKQYEGSLYPNTTTGGSPQVQEQDAVPPGGCAVYKWIVASSQAPAKGQDSRLWSYHSYVNMAADIAAGLTGPTIVYTQGKMAEVMAGNREFILNYGTYDERVSWLVGKNAANAGLTNVSSFGGNSVGLVGGMPHIGNESFWVPSLTNNPDAQLSTQQAPIFYTLNGYVLANGYPFEMCRNDPVIWYVMTYGNYAHTFHMHGNNFQVNGMDPWQAALNLNVGEMFTLNMAAQLPGIWQVICHVAMHLVFGMEQNYQVYEIEEYGGSCPLPPLTQKLAGSA